jgi:hypothetical protein
LKKQCSLQALVACYLPDIQSKDTLKEHLNYSVKQFIQNMQLLDH